MEMISQLQALAALLPWKEPAVFINQKAGSTSGPVVVLSGLDKVS
jgi:hypothetical protein